jgi:hypothetical protein
VECRFVGLPEIQQHLRQGGVRRGVLRMLRHCFPSPSGLPLQFIGVCADEGELQRNDESLKARLPCRQTSTALLEHGP